MNFLVVMLMSWGIIPFTQLRSFGITQTQMMPWLLWRSDRLIALLDPPWHQASNGRDPNNNLYHNNIFYDNQASMVPPENMVDSTNVDQYCWVDPKFVRMISFFWSAWNMENDLVDLDPYFDWWASPVIINKRICSSFKRCSIPFYECLFYKLKMI